MRDQSIRALREFANFFTSRAVRIGQLITGTLSRLTPRQKIQLAVEQTLADLRMPVVCFEGLEDRQLFAGISLSGNVLTITGNSSGYNKLGVNYNSAGQLVAQFNNTTKTYSASSVSSIKINGGSSADYLYITSATIKRGTFVGGGGNDTVWAGNGNDTIYGEAGNDYLNGRGGNDVIYGGDGSDRIDGGAGTDTTNSGNPASTTTPQSPDGVTVTDPTKPYPPLPPSNLAASSASSSSIKLTWSDNTNRELGYKIDRSTDGSSWSQVATTGASVATYTDSGLSSGKKYYYRVRAYNEYGNSSYTNTANATTGSTSTGGGTTTPSTGTTDPTKPYPPVSPTNLSASSASSTSIKLTWSDNTNRELGYKIDRSTDGSSWSQVATTGASVATYTDSGLTSGKKYYYRVRAYNEYGNSSYTNTANATTGSTSTGGGSTGGTTGGTIIPHDANAASPNAVITSLSSSTNAGIAVNVQAMNSTLGSGTPLTARYEWNFGDSGSKYNTLVGFNAAHVYDNAGTYTLTLKIINESGKSDTATKTITVNSANRKVLYVSGSGSDSNSGTSTSSPLKTFARAAQIIGDNSNYAVYFNRGNTFNVSNTMSLGGSNIVVGAYGSGSMPILKWNGPRQFDAWIWARGTNSGTTVQDLVFDSIYTDSDSSNMPDALTSSGTNFTARNCQFINVGAAFNGNMQPRGVLIQDNNAPSVTGIKAYFVWAEGSDYTILGNKVVNSTREHILRVGNADRVTAEYNDFTNMNRVSVDKYDTAKGDMTLHKGNYMYIANNTLTSGPLSFGPLGGSTGTGDKGARLNWVVSEANKLNTQTLVLHGTQHVMARNNVTTISADNAYTVDGWNSEYSRGVTDLRLYNNTGIDTDDKDGIFLKVQGDVNGIDLVNNLFVAPNLVVNNGMPVYVNDSNLNSFHIITNNVWSVKGSSSYAAGGVNYIWPSWSNSAGFQTPSEWNAISQVGTDIFSTVTLSGYTPSSAATSAGTWTPGVFYDYYNKLRPTSGIAAGAVEA